MTPDLTPAAPIPFRRLLLMPWRWSRWTWAILPPLMLLAYVFSAVPVLRLASQKMKLGPNIEYVSLAYRPVWKIESNCSPVTFVIDWEDRMMTRIIGENVIHFKLGGISYKGRMTISVIEIERAKCK